MGVREHARQEFMREAPESLRLGSVLNSSSPENERRVFRTDPVVCLKNDNDDDVLLVPCRRPVPDSQGNFEITRRLGQIAPLATMSWNSESRPRAVGAADRVFNTNTEWQRRSCGALAQHAHVLRSQLLPSIHVQS